LRVFRYLPGVVSLIAGGVVAYLAWQFATPEVTLAAAPRSMIDQAFPLLFVAVALYLFWQGARDVLRAWHEPAPPPQTMRRSAPAPWPQAAAAQPVPNQQRAMPAPLTEQQRTAISGFLGAFRSFGVLPSDVTAATACAAVEATGLDWATPDGVLAGLLEQTPEGFPNVLDLHLDGTEDAATYEELARQLAALSDGALPITAIKATHRGPFGQQGGSLSFDLNGQNFTWTYTVAGKWLNLRVARQFGQLMREKAGGQRFAILQVDMNVYITRLPDGTLDRLNAALDLELGDGFEWLDSLDLGDPDQ
jgi:hypothetical protein